MDRNFGTTVGTARKSRSRVAVFLGIALWAGAVGATPYQAAGTKRMAERLKKITAQSEPRNNLYMNDARTELFGKELKEALEMPDTPEKGAKVLDLDSKYATELLLAGRSWEAIQQFT